MDHSANNMFQRLKNNPAQLQALIQSQDGQNLMRLLTQKDQGSSLQHAVQSASNGNPAEMARMIQNIMQTPDGSALIERIRKSMET